MLKNKPTVVIVTNIVAPYRVDLFTKIMSINKNIRLVVIFCGKNYQNRDWIINKNIPFECEVLSPLLINIGKKRFQLNFNLIYRIYKLRPTGVISSEFSIPTLQSWLASKIIKCKFGIWSDGIPHSERNITVLQKFIRKYLLKKSDVVIASCNDAIDNISSYGVRKSRIYLSGLTGNYSELGKLSKASLNKKAIIRKQLNVLDRFTFIFVGSLIRRKGVLQLFDAFTMLANEGVNANLIILGTGVLENELYSRIEKSSQRDRISLIGFIQNNDIAKYYVAADCFVLPTFDDPFGLVIAEAAAAGLPIITTPYAGATREFVEHGKNGYIVEPFDIMSLATSMKMMVKLSISERNNMSEYSLKKASLWTIDHSASGFVQAAESLLNTPTISTQNK